MEEEKSLLKRNKYWDELTDQEKIDRMRSEVKGMQSRLDSALKSVEALLRHDHNNGQLIVPLNDSRNYLDGSQRAFRDEKYF